MKNNIYTLYVIYRRSDEDDEIEYLVYDTDDLEYKWSILDLSTYHSKSSAEMIAKLMCGKVGCFQAVLQKD
jgi:hypothetical protein